MKQVQRLGFVASIAADGPMTTVVIYLTFLAITVTPLAVARIPPITDYHNYVALFHVLVNYPISAYLQEYYYPNVSLNGNMALVLGALPLVHVFGPELGLRLFAVAMIITVTSGVVILQRVLHGRWSVISCAGFLLVYNHLFLWGFFSFLFTLGLALWATAAWIATREWPLASRAAIGGFTALVLGFGHLVAFGVYGLIVGGYELVRLYRKASFRDGSSWQDSALTLAPLLLPIGLVAFFGEDAPIAAQLAWSPLTARLEEWAGPFMNYSMVADVTTMLFLAAVVAILILTKRLTIAPVLIGGLVLLALVQVVIPYSLAGARMADRRIPIAWFLFAVAATTLVRTGPKVKVILIGLIALVLLARVGLIVRQWRGMRSIYSEYLRAFETMPFGAKLLTVTLIEDSPAKVTPRFEWVTGPRRHIGAYAVVTRDAFVPSLFTGPSQHLAFRPEIASLARATNHMEWYNRDPANEERGRLNLYAGCFDYLLVNGPDRIDVIVPDRFVETFRGDGFRLFQNKIPAGFDGQTRCRPQGDG